MALLSPFVELHGLSMVNSVITRVHAFIDDYRPEGVHLYKTFPVPGHIAVLSKYVCGYASWYCEYWSFHMSHSTD